MQLLNGLLDFIRGGVRAVMHVVAAALNRLSGGRISPNSVTIISFLAHIVIAWLIATRHPIWAAGLLVIFGLFDALDGELARLQNRASAAGMLLDATTDRLKEVLLYIGSAYFFVVIDLPYAAVWAVAACGASLSVSYVKAKGETAMKDSRLGVSEINRMFQDGLMRYEVRMFLLVVGLVTSLLPEMISLIAVLATMTAFGRLISISRRLS